MTVMKEDETSKMSKNWNPEIKIWTQKELHYKCTKSSYVVSTALMSSCLLCIVWNKFKQCILFDPGFIKEAECHFTMFILYTKTCDKNLLLLFSVNEHVTNASLLAFILAEINASIAKFMQSQMCEYIHYVPVLVQGSPSDFCHKACVRFLVTL